MSLGPLLRSQSEQRRAERFLRAEKLALEAPVKMLFPMVFCIFPCTFLIIGFPIVTTLLAFDSLTPTSKPAQHRVHQIGRPSCWERECKYVYIQVVAV